MREGSGRIVLMDFGAGELRTERSGAGSAAHAAVSGARVVRRRACDDCQRRLQHGRAAVPPRHGKISGRRRDDGADRGCAGATGASHLGRPATRAPGQLRGDRRAGARPRSGSPLSDLRRDAARTDGRGAAVRATAGSRQCARSIGTNRVAGRPAVCESRPRSRCRVPLQRPGRRTAHRPWGRSLGSASSRAHQRPMPPARRHGHSPLCRRLGVDAAIEGTVRKSGDRVRITAQLVSALDGCHLWSDGYDRARAMSSRSSTTSPAVRSIG